MRFLPWSGSILQSSSQDHNITSQIRSSRHHTRAVYNPTPIRIEGIGTHDANRSRESDNRLWFAPRDSFSDGNAGAVSFTMAPTTTPAATIPLVCALAGNGTWLAYVLATVGVMLVALCIGRYARHSSSPGSLYTYASMILPAWLSATVAWSLLLAYVATGSSVIGGFYHYANLLLYDATGRSYSAVALATLVTTVSIWIAYRDVKISARLMLWIEAASVSVIVIVIALLLVRHGWHWDWDELHLRGMSRTALH